MGKIANNQIKARATIMMPEMVKARLHPFHVKLTFTTSFIFPYKIDGIEAFYTTKETFAIFFSRKKYYSWRVAT
jgi:hypothetical protein